MLRALAVPVVKQAQRLRASWPGWRARAWRARRRIAVASFAALAAPFVFVAALALITPLPAELGEPAAPSLRVLARSRAYQRASGAIKHFLAVGYSARGAPRVTPSDLDASLASWRRTRGAALVEPWALDDRLWNAWISPPPNIAITRRRPQPSAACDAVPHVSGRFPRTSRNYTAAFRGRATDCCIWAAAGRGVATTPRSSPAGSAA